MSISTLHVDPASHEELEHDLYGVMRHSKWREPRIKERRVLDLTIHGLDLAIQHGYEKAPIAQKLVSHWSATDEQVLERAVRSVCAQFDLDADKAHVSGTAIYPRLGWLGWHTNANQPGTRIYAIHNASSWKSFFRYFDSEGKDILTNWELAGWTLRRFEITGREDPLWHCVFAGCQRFALGIRFEP